MRLCEGSSNEHSTLKWLLSEPNSKVPGHARSSPQCSLLCTEARLFALPSTLLYSTPMLSPAITPTPPSRSAKPCSSHPTGSSASSLPQPRQSRQRSKYSTSQGEDTERNRKTRVQVSTRPEANSTQGVWESRGKRRREAQGRELRLL